MLAQVFMSRLSKARMRCKAVGPSPWQPDRRKGGVGLAAAAAAAAAADASFASRLLIEVVSVGRYDPTDVHREMG